MRTIVEESMLELMYEIPGDKTITKVVIEEDFILKKAPARILRTARPKAKKEAEGA